MKSLIIILLTISLTCQAQDAKYFAYNVISSSLISGIGSGFHKNPCETFGHAFINGVWKGAIGGSLITLSKDMLHWQAENNKINWPTMWTSKIINSFGNITLNNAILNEPHLLKNYSINIGFIRLSKTYGIQIDPISLGCMGYILLDGGKLNFNKSITTGTPIFEKAFRIITTDKQIIVGTDIVFYSYPEHKGRKIGNNVLLDKIKGSSNVLCHELTHIYQKNQFMSINNLFKIYNRFENYKFIHNDFSLHDFTGSILNKVVGYKNNFFEKEARFYSDE
jgi:hypothetical protein